MDERRLGRMLIMRLAYLTSTYPSVSHTFIRRELKEMERRGLEVLRLSIREPDWELVDAEDWEEREKTRYCLGSANGRSKRRRSTVAFRLMLSLAWTFIVQPRKTYRAASAAVQMGRRGRRGILRHLAYLAEAAWMLRVLRRHTIEHVHVHFGHNPAAAARLIRLLGGPPYSVTFHGTETFDAPEFMGIDEKIADAEFAVAVSDYGAAQLRRWTAYERWSKIQVVHCTADDAFFDEATPVDQRSKLLVCVGRLSAEKGHLVLIDALEEVVRGGVDVKLALIGEGPMRSIIEDRIRAAGLTGHVKLTGALDGAGVRRHILAGRAVVQPSFAEGLPTVIMEAFALRRPVIGAWIAGIPELVRPEKTGWLTTPGRVDELAEAIRDALSCPAALLDAYGAAGRALVRRNHSVATEAAKLEMLITGRGGEAGVRTRDAEGLEKGAFSRDRDRQFSKPTPADTEAGRC